MTAERIESYPRMAMEMQRQIDDIIAQLIDLVGDNDDAARDEEICASCDLLIDFATSLAETTKDMLDE